MRLYISEWLPCATFVPPPPGRTSDRYSPAESCAAAPSTWRFTPACARELRATASAPPCASESAASAAVGKIVLRARPG